MWLFCLRYWNVAWRDTIVLGTDMYLRQMCFFGKYVMLVLPQPLYITIRTITSSLCISLQMVWNIVAKFVIYGRFSLKNMWWMAYISGLCLPQSPQLYVRQNRALTCRWKKLLCIYTDKSYYFVWRTGKHSFIYFKGMQD